MYQTFFKPLYLDIKTFILDILFPVSCLACGKEGGEFLCLGCKDKLNKVHQICIMCQKPSLGGLTHSGCKTAFAPDGLVSIFDYHDTNVSKLIIVGKYYFIPAIYKQLGKIIVQKISANHPHLLTPISCTLIPIPLHWSRKRWRGFNQAEILCRTLAEELQLNYADILDRQTFTRTQKNLKKDRRIKNLAGVFSLKNNLKIQGQNFILVDDVATTGTTLLEAVKVLKQNGANKIWCLAAAKD